MATHYTTGVPCVDLYDVENYGTRVLSGTNISDIDRQLEYVNARQNLKIDIHKFYLWMYRSVWDCDLTISASARIGQELFGTSGGVQNYYTTRIQSAQKVGIVQHGRDRKIQVVDSLGKTTLIDDASNLLPTGYPKDLLYKIRSNPCYPTNGSVVYFDCMQRTENFVYAVLFKERPAPKFESSAYENVTITKREFGIYNFHIFSGTRYIPVKCEIYLNPGESFYDYSQKKYLPDVSFGSSPATWIGLLPSDNASTNFTQNSTLSVDGISIQSAAGLDFGQGAGNPSDPEESAQLNVSLKWKISQERDL